MRRRLSYTTSQRLICNKTYTDKKLLKNVICGIVMLKVVSIVQYLKVRCAIPNPKTANYCSMHPLIHTLLALTNTES